MSRTPASTSSKRCFNGLGPLDEQPRYSLLHMADELTLLYQFRLMYS